MTTIKEACRNYFHLIRHPAEKKNRALTAVAILSCITVIVPIAVGVVYGLSKLAGRIKKGERNPDIEKTASKTFTSSSKPSSTPSTDLSTSVISIDPEISPSLDASFSSSEDSISSETPVSSSEEPINPVRQKLLDDFTPQMVEALGGIDAVEQMPIYENWKGTRGPIFSNESAPPASITRYYDSFGMPFLIFFYYKKVPHGWMAYVDFLTREKSGWIGPSSELSRTVVGKNIIKSSEPNAEWERILLDKVRRLARGEPVGLVKEHTDELPEDAFMQGEDFAALGLRYYEQRPTSPTDIFLGDSTKDVTENLQLAKARLLGNQ